MPFTTGHLKEAVTDPTKVLRYLRRRVRAGTAPTHNSVDRSTLRELLWMHELYRMITDVPGHIVELGTGPGTNAITIGNLLHLYGDDDIRQYYGFDTFEGYPPEDAESSPYLNVGRWEDVNVGDVRDRLYRHGVSDVTTLIEGDLVQTLPSWIEGDDSRKSPGTVYVALVYVDCNAYRAAREGIDLLRDHLSPGAIVAVDQLKHGGETKALREFCDKRDLPFRRAPPPIAHAPYTVMPERD